MAHSGCWGSLAGSKALGGKPLLLQIDAHNHLVPLHHEPSMLHLWGPAVRDRMFAIESSGCFYALQGGPGLKSFALFMP